LLLTPDKTGHKPRWKFEAVEMEGNDDVRMAGCEGAASALKGARMQVHFSGATGLDDVVIQQIDMGPEGAPATLTREAALAWLLRRTALRPQWEMQHRRLGFKRKEERAHA